MESMNSKLLNLLSDNLAAANSQLDSKVKEMEENLTDPHSELESSIKDARACTAGFFRIGNQCFKLFTDARRSWHSAKIKCQDEGLQQAKPNDPVTLRKYIVDNFDTKYSAWLGARGDNTALKWERNGMRISSSNPLWFTGYPGRYVTTSSCLSLRSKSVFMKKQPSHPFQPSRCTATFLYALCEG
ncbi:unnamed protein product [Meganyctiphanes norvegica]|uniref:C-type lectin domain-containing protein n=1 Tax=Meganyctiphanes norvegica TaxID=48144 RepID=A0AAV2QQN7_MEGNR